MAGESVRAIARRFCRYGAPHEDCLNCEAHVRLIRAERRRAVRKVLGLKRETNGPWVIASEVIDAILVRRPPRKGKRDG